MGKRGKARPPQHRQAAQPGPVHQKAGSRSTEQAQADALIPRILAQLNRGEVQAAMGMIEAGMRMAPAHPEFPHLAGQVLLGLPQANTAEARQWLEKAVELAPRNPQYHLTLGNALLVEGDPESALDHARRAVRADARLAAAHTSIGIALSRLKRLAEASEAFANAARLEPRNPDSWLNLAVCRMELGDVDGVLEAVERLEKLGGDPSAPVLHRIGNIYRGVGRHATAMDYYRRSLAREPDAGHVWFALADSCSRLGEFAKAEEALSEAERCDYNACSICSSRARIAGQQRRITDAKSLLAEAVELAKGNVSHLLPIAKEYALIGDFDAQYETLKRVLEQDPDNVGAFANLAAIPGRTLDPTRVARLEEIVNDATIEPGTRSLVGFTLGDLFRHERDFDRSFRYYRLGNQLKGFKFDEKAYRDWQARVENAFSEQFFEHCDRFGSPSSDPILIVGMPRSGTTLTEQIISSHPSVYGAGEAGNVAWLAGIPGMERAFEAPIDDLLKTDAAHLSDYASQYVKSIMAFTKSGETRFTNKTPNNFQQLGLFALLFPKAPIVHIKRDPRDNLLSIYFHDFALAHEHAYDLKELGRYYRWYERLMAHWAKVIPNPIYELQYEDLVADLEGKTAELAGFLGLDLDEHMLRFWEQDRQVKTASQWQVRQPVYSSSVGRWKPYEKHLKPLFEGLGL